MGEVIEKYTQATEFGDVNGLDSTRVDPSLETGIVDPDVEAILQAVFRQVEQSLADENYYSTNSATESSALVKAVQPSRGVDAAHLFAPGVNINSEKISENVNFDEVSKLAEAERLLVRELSFTGFSFHLTDMFR